MGPFPCPRVCIASISSSSDSILPRHGQEVTRGDKVQKVGGVTQIRPPRGSAVAKAPQALANASLPNAQCPARPQTNLCFTFPVSPLQSRLPPHLAHPSKQGTGILFSMAWPWGRALNKSQKPSGIEIPIWVFQDREPPRLPNLIQIASPIPPKMRDGGVYGSGTVHRRWIG